jgi:hypothetical protein
MKCPKCKHDYPRGGKFCSNCGYEPKEYWWWFIIGAALAAVGVWRMLKGVWEGALDDLAFGGGFLGLGIWTFITHYRWLRWTRPLESNEIAPSDSA